MNKIRVGAAILLAIPLLVFGANFFAKVFDLPMDSSGSGGQLLKLMHEGGLMAYIAASHVVVGLMLVNPKTRMIGALLQLPMSIGIAAFHFTMMREGLVVALVMLGLNLVVLLEPPRLRSLGGSSGR